MAYMTPVELKDQDSVTQDLKLHMLYHVRGISAKIGHKDCTNHMQRRSSGGEDPKRTKATEINLQLAEEEKLKGNECVRKEEWTNTVKFYTEAIK